MSRAAAASCRSTAPRTASSTRRSTSRWSVPSSSGTAPASSTPRSSIPSHPIMKGFEPFRTWDETYVHTKHNEKDRHVLQTRAEGQTGRALDLGAHAGQGARLLHGLWPRRPDLAESRLPRPARARHPLGVEQGRGLRQPGPRRRPGCRRSRTRSRRPRSPTICPAGDGARRASRSADAAAAVAGRVDASTWSSRRVRAAAVRRRARDRQADLHDLGPPRPALDRRERRLSQHQAARRPGPRPDHDLRRHRRRRPGRQVHGLRRQAQHPHQPRFRQTAA